MLYTQRMTCRHYAGRIKLDQMRIVSTSNNIVAGQRKNCKFTGPEI